MIKVFKFGGASVKDSAAVRNMCDIVRSLCSDSLVVVVSAMGKTTNAIERIHAARFRGESYQVELEELTRYHEQMVAELFGDDASGSTALRAQLEALGKVLNDPGSGNFDQDYDSLIGYGELISTAIVQAYLSSQEIASVWFDARDIVITDNRFRDARVNWEKSAACILPLKGALSENNVCVIQGFIGSTPDGHSTSLGREGSDFTASIMAYLLDATDVTIWKDVPGMLNADPKKFDDTVKLDQISFKEAIELAYYGASVIHPKTIKPLQNKGIPLWIKSFVNPELSGTLIHESTANDHRVPSYIIKENQVLVSVSTRDFSFIVEDNLKEIFDCLSRLGIRIHLMENSAISFSLVFDYDDYKLNSLLQELNKSYQVLYNEALSLMTVRHFDESIVKKLTADKEIILEQRNRNTLRMLLKM
jgi:aspartate kinase